MISHQFLQPCEANAHLTTLQNRYTVLKKQTRIMQTQQLLGISRFPSQHLEESRSDVLGRKNWVKNLYSQEESSVSFWAVLFEAQNSGFLIICIQPDDLSPMPRYTVFFEKLRHSKLCCYTRRSNECSKREESWLASSTYIFWFHKWYFQRRLNRSSLVNFLKRSIDSTELIMKRSKGPCLIK